MKRAKSFTLLLLVALALPACSNFSADQRNQRAYEKYVRKSSAMRKEQRAKVQRSQQEIPETEARTEINTATEPTMSDG